ncbi:MAG: alpha/beta fold hydrolase [Candidatus Hermodarchaeota archaeon]
MTIAKLNNTEIYYDEHGSGVPFLVMHGGLGIDHSYFRPAIDPLGDIFKLIFYDHRGEGRSGRPPFNTITLEQLADDANSLRKILGYKNIGLIGHSFGGSVALHYATRHPKKISYLILMNASPAFDYWEEVMKHIMQKNLTPEMRETLNAPVDRTIEGFRKQFKITAPLYFYRYNSEMEKLINKILKKMILNPETAALNETILPNYNVLSKLTEIEIPTLILAGKNDIITPLSQAQRIYKKIPNSELHIFEKSGHYPFYEEPNEVFGVIRGWFKKVYHKQDIH